VAFSKYLVDNPLDTSTDDLDYLALSFSQLIQNACRRTMPIRQTVPVSKAWWTPELRVLRRKLAKERRALHAAPRELHPSEKQGFLDARNSYFLAIKNAKRDH
jgi:hypothetical protein